MGNTKEIFKKRKRLQMIVTSVVVIMIIVLVVTGFEKIGSILVFVALIFSKFNWRCPKCNSYLGKGNPKHCIKCGEQLV